MGYPTYEENGAGPLDRLAAGIAENAKAKGFRGAEGDLPRELMLIVSECAEALEEDREGTPTLYVEIATGKPQGVLPELADVLIRTLETMHHVNGPQGYSIDEIVEMKMAYNATWEYRHGGKAY